MNHRVLLATLLGLVLPVAAGARPEGEFAAHKLSFSVLLGDETTSYDTLAVSVLPGATLPIEVIEASPDSRFAVSAAEGSLRTVGERRWEWSAPASGGPHPIVLQAADTGETMRLNAFVLVPMARVSNGRLNGYRIGAYPAIPLRGLPVYEAPAGLIEVTPDNLDTPVSPHFRLGQFVCKQDGGYPKYVVLRERLLLKLELLLEQVNEAGFRADTFHVMSGYRTPAYNHSIGNVRYSRHVYGGAADIFIDEDPVDGVMDDLNRDGSVDVRDAALLYELIDHLYGTDTYQAFVGGLGRYKKTKAHGPFVHVDVRGFRARWWD